MKALFRMVSLPYYQPSERRRRAAVAMVPGSLLSLMGRPSLSMQHHAAAAAATGLSLCSRHPSTGEMLDLSGRRGGGVEEHDMRNNCPFVVLLYYS